MFGGSRMVIRDSADAPPAAGGDARREMRPLVSQRVPLGPNRRHVAARQARSESTRAVIETELVLVAAAALTYGLVRELTEGSIGTAIANGRSVLRLEKALGIAWEAELQATIEGRALLVDLANWIYIWGHWPVIAVCAAALFWRRLDRYRLLRNALLISGAIGFLFFGLLPTAPPRLADVGLMDTIVERSSSYRALQPPSLTNQYAAMPSLHFGWNLLVGIVLFASTSSQAVRGFALAMPIAMGFSVIVTGNHWVLDVVVAAAVVVVAYGLALRFGPAAAMSQPGWSAAGETGDTTQGGQRPERPKHHHRGEHAERRVDERDAYLHADRERERGRCRRDAAQPVHHEHLLRPDAAGRRLHDGRQAA